MKIIPFVTLRFACRLLNFKIRFVLSFFSSSRTFENFPNRQTGETCAAPFSVVRVADQMRVEVVHVRATHPTPVTPPRVTLRVEPSMKEVQGLVGEHNVTIVTLPRTRADLLGRGTRGLDRGDLLRPRRD